MALIRGHWTPKFDLEVAWAVACPEDYCKAAATWPCTTKGGKISSTVHVSRIEVYRASKGPLYN